MRVAALYDIHGNLPALDAVLADVARVGVDRIVVGGDVVPGPLPRECVDRLLALDVPVDFIHGNGDREILALLRGQAMTSVPPAFRDVMQWTAETLGPGYEAILGGWPSTFRLTIDPLGRVLFCHATPRNDTEIFTRQTPEAALLPVFADAGADIVVCGHTHMQMDRTVGGVRVVNAGSVGMPFGLAGAYWLLLGPAVELRHTMYDLDAAADRIRRSPYPQGEAFATGNVLHPPAEADILARYAAVEIR